MILITLKLNHFKQYQELELNFREGLAGIVGRNGAGKSSVFEAVLLCLFGEIKMDKNFIRSSWATTKQPVVLDLTFEVEGKTYRVHREYRGKAMTHQAQLYDHKEESLAAGAKPVTDSITELIGMDKDSFVRSIFSGQKELGEISNTKGEERRKMIRKMVGLDKLDKIQNIIREDRNKIKSEIKGKENLLYEAEDIKAFEAELKTQKKTLDKEDKQATKLKKQLDDKQALYLKAQKAFESENEKYKRHNELLHSFNKFENGVENFTARANEHKAKIEQLQKTKAALKKVKPQIEAFEKQKEALKKLEVTKTSFEQINSINQNKSNSEQQLKEEQQTIAALDKELKTLPKIEKELSENIKINEAQQAKITTKEEDIAKLNHQRGAIAGKINDRKNSIDNIQQLGKDAECPTCFQPLLKTYDETLSRLQTDIEKYERKDLETINKTLKVAGQGLEKLKTEYKQNKETENNLKSQITILNDKKQDHTNKVARAQQRKTEIEQLDAKIKAFGKVTFDPNNYQKLREAIQVFEAKYIKYRSQLDDVEQIPAIEEKKLALVERIKNGKAAIKSQQIKITKLGFKEKQYEAALSQQQKLEQEKGLIQESLNEQKETVFNLKGEIQKIVQDLQHNEKVLKSIKEQRDEFQELETLDVVFTKFKTNILERVKPVISHHSSKLFNQITKGRYESIRVDNNFEFHIFDNGDYYPITRFSGGEIDLANLCLRIGISKAISDLSGSSAANSLLCFDEIFGSQDEERRFEILNALDLLKEQYRQIYIISHIESIKDHFPNILQVRKTQTGSFAEWTDG